MSKPVTTEDLLRELELMKDYTNTLAVRQRRLLEAAREIVAGGNPKPTEALKT